ncbi:MAG TPA: regulatory protein RecX [Vicinamibacterales bacterium]|jgi:regulatory protein
MSDPVRAAYAAGLAMLARRELSEAQVRERLARREHAAEAIESAVSRLREVGAVDDRRVARNAALTEAKIKSRGRARICRHLQAIGIATDVADEALDEVFGALDESALLERALGRRLRGPAARIRDAAHFRRLLQALVRQGFSPSAVITALKARAKRDVVPEDEPE